MAIEENGGDYKHEAWPEQGHEPRSEVHGGSDGAAPDWYPEREAIESEVADAPAAGPDPIAVSTPESEADRVRSFVRRVSERMSAAVADWAGRFTLIGENPASPPDKSVPLSLEQFEGIASIYDCARACAQLTLRSALIYKKYPASVIRAIAAADLNNQRFEGGVAIRMDYADERGEVGIQLNNSGSLYLKVVQLDGAAETYRYEPVQRNGLTVMQKQKVLIAPDESTEIGKVSTAEAMRAWEAAEAANGQFDRSVRDLTQEQEAYVGPAEAAFLDSLIAAARPAGIRHDRYFRWLHRERYESGVEPRLFDAAWASNELELLIDEHIVRRGLEPVEELFIDRSVRVTAWPAVGDEPAHIIARTVHTVPVSKLHPTMRRGQPMEALATVVYETTITPGGDRIILDASLSATLADSDGTRTNPELPFFEDKARYDNGDIAEVNAFRLLLNGPR